MIEQLIYQYKKVASTYALIFRFMKWRYYSLVFSFILFSLTTVLGVGGLLWYYYIKHGFLIHIAISYIISILFFVTTLHLLNKRAKMILRRKYKIKTSGWMWRTREFDELQNNRIIIFLRRNSLYNEKKIKLLIETLDKEIERMRIPSLIAPGIFISLFLPIWVQFLTYLFKQVGGIADAIQLLMGLALFVLTLIYVFSFSQWIIRETSDLISMNEVTIRKKIIVKLEELLLLLPTDESESGNRDNAEERMREVL